MNTSLNISTHLSNSHWFCRLRLLNSVLSGEFDESMVLQEATRDMDDFSKLKCNVSRVMSISHGAKFRRQRMFTKLTGRNWNIFRIKASQLERWRNWHRITPNYGVIPLTRKYTSMNKRNILTCILYINKFLQQLLNWTGLEVFVWVVKV